MHERAASPASPAGGCSVQGLRVALLLVVPIDLGVPTHLYQGQRAYCHVAGVGGLAGCRHPDLQMLHLVLNILYEEGQLLHKPTDLLGLHGQVHASGGTPQSQATLGKLVHAHRVAAVFVEKLEERPNVAGLDLQGGEEGLHAFILDVPLQLRQRDRPSAVRVDPLEALPDPVDVGLPARDLVLQHCVLVTLSAVNCRLTENGSDDVEHRK
mmetsp:Transcript_112075/g.350564  ORF Transcript_112075/g.350564 Transcript_112075/m.350564 type:complete len:211 (+) Transcript_112075:2-634(+)